MATYLNGCASFLDLCLFAQLFLQLLLQDDIGVDDTAVLFVVAVVVCFSGFFALCEIYLLHLIFMIIIAKTGFY